MKKAVCALIIGNDGNMLAIARDNQCTSFGLIGGKCEDNETIEEAIIREVKEEAGIDILEMENIFCETCKGTTDYESTTFFVRRYSGIPSSQPGEYPVRWISFLKLIHNSPFGEYNTNLFTNFFKYAKERLL